MVEIKNKSGEVIYTYEGESLSDADLRGAYLRYADLRGESLSDADLRGAYLRYADLRGADLRGADLRCADLRGADLRGAYLRYADLRYADLSDAYLRYADLSDAITEFGVLRDIMQVSNIGSRKDTTVVYHTEQGIFVKCGCFKGSLAEFEAKVKEVHKGNHHEKTYLAMIEMIKVRFLEK